MTKKERLGWAIFQSFVLLAVGLGLWLGLWAAGIVLAILGLLTLVSNIILCGKEDSDSDEEPERHHE
jgi:hypothetical protein